MFIFFSLLSDLLGKVLEIIHDERIQHLDILVVLCAQMVLHEADFLPKKFNLLLVVSEGNLRKIDEFLKKAVSNRHLMHVRELTSIRLAPPLQDS